MSKATNRLWHPFAAMGKVDGHELVLVRGEGCRVWDTDGAEYLDATAGLWFASVGHGRAEIVAQRRRSRRSAFVRSLVRSSPSGITRSTASQP